MNTLPRIMSVNILDDFWNFSTIAWAAIWATVFYLPGYLLKNREMIINVAKGIDQNMLNFGWQMNTVFALGTSMMYHDISRKPFTESELAEWKEVGILLRKTKHGYVWRNAN